MVWWNVILKHGLSMLCIISPCSFQEFLFNALHEVSPWLSLYYLDIVKAKTFKEIFDKISPEEVARTCTSFNIMLLIPLEALCLYHAICWIADSVLWIFYIYIFISRNDYRQKISLTSALSLKVCFWEYFSADYSKIQELPWCCNFNVHFLRCSIALN